MQHKRAAPVDVLQVQKRRSAAPVVDQVQKRRGLAAPNYTPVRVRLSSKKFFIWVRSRSFV